MDTTQINFLTMPLSRENHETARKFSVQQDTVEKGEQVYLNTLAILGVRSFLDWLGIETDLNAGDSWHSVVRCFQDVADLVIPNLGKLECRPVLPGQTVISLPPEVTEDRIAYIGVQFQEQLNEVQLLGFYPTIDPQAPPGEIEIASLQPIETLIDYIDRLESAHFFLPNEEVAIKVRDRLAIQSISEIITQLERIYRTYNKYERRYAGGEFLASYLPTTKGVSFRGSTPVADREEFDDSQQTELQDLAEELLEKLDEIWGGDDSDESVNSESSTNQSSDTPGQIPQAAMVPPSPTTTGLISLNEWLQKSESNSQYNWQSLESFLSNQEGNLIFRFASAPRSRTADTESPTLSASKVREISLAGNPVVLIVNCQKNTEKTEVLIRLYPLSAAQTYLPAGIKLIVIDSESGEIFLEAQARSADNWIQLEFSGEVGEPFSIKIALEDAEITEHFAI
ncbi:DUF1822 family protein [Microcoleus sp. CAWBG640]|uniref:DUF1822 family protein n=1 Tax=Microcoleus sp. CAWBG640 TaxID=2841653 RepID=UPI00312B6D17